MTRKTFVAVLFLLVPWGPVLPNVPVGEEGLETGKLNPSERCATCHVQIHETWKRSMHSAAASDPIFRMSYLKAYADSEGKAREICLPCHAPAAARNPALGVRDSLNQEGITCDFCHSVSAVDLSRRTNPFRVLLDGVKRGPLGDAESPVHEVAQSDLHKSSEFCAGCHQYTNEHGLEVFSTYSEWKESPNAAEGQTCQHCHMPLVEGETVSPEFGIRRKKINLHNISGGHSREQVQKAARMRVVDVRRGHSNTAIVQVEVANTGSGHSIPTGLPTRKLVLEVVLKVDGQEHRRLRREYQKVLVDVNGEVITEDHRTILDSRKVLRDTRLRAGERRLEEFETLVPRVGRLYAEATLRYMYEPEVLVRERMSIDMASSSFPD